MSLFGNSLFGKTEEKSLYTLSRSSISEQEANTKEKESCCCWKGLFVLDSSDQTAYTDLDLNEILLQVEPFFLKPVRLPKPPAPIYVFLLPHRILEGDVVVWKHLFWQLDAENSPTLTTSENMHPDLFLYLKSL
jgi:hypothetical protein